MAREVAVSMAHAREVPLPATVAGPDPEETVVFDPWCPTCSARVLLTARRLLGLAPTPTGHRASLRCWCGTVVAMDVERIGVGSERPPVVGDASPVPGASPTAA